MLNILVNIIIMKIIFLNAKSYMNSFEYFGTSVCFRYCFRYANLYMDYKFLPKICNESKPSSLRTFYCCSTF